MEEDVTEAMDSEPKQVFCEPCKHMGKECSAENFCIDCDEHLCNGCKQLHIVSKMTKGHNVVSTNDEAYEKTREQSTNLFCNPCNALEQSSQASSFCGECDELLCSNCVGIHGAQKATKQHILATIDTYLSRNQKQCDMCEGTPGINFCKECEQTLCDKCSKRHAVQKATKSHSLIPASEIGVQDPLYCNPCLYREEHSPAQKYCSECEENLCESCSLSHQSRKATKSHKLMKIEDIVDENKNICDVCHYSGKRQDAIFACLECDEHLCSDCKSMHQKQKATRNHEIVDINSLNKTKKKLCDVCKEDDVSEEAIIFCEECKELLCQRCSDMHRRRKATKEHVLIAPSQSTTEELCQPCLEGEEKIPAEMFCKQCKESLCTSCCKLHRNQKATKGHELCHLNDKPSNNVFCDICFMYGKKVKASKICEVCKENLCGDCTKQHMRQKATKSHTISNIPDEDKTAPRCDPCSRLDVNSQSRVYCKQCEEYFCTACESQHALDKSTSTHSIIDATDSKVISICCAICKANDKQCGATSFCLTCSKPEPFCDDCSKRHRNIKANLHHKISHELAHFETSLESQTAASSSSESAEIHVQPTEDEGGQVTKVLIDERKPGKPKATQIKADSLELSWERPAAFTTGDTYQVRYKDLDAGSKWTLMSSEYTASTIVLADLKANTKFIFQVRLVKDDEEGPYSDQSDEIFTLMSPAARLEKWSTRINDDKPSKYALPLTEVRDARCAAAKSRKFEIGSPPQNIKKERTIMLVGATGTGKSTLVDGLVNYILGVNWNDPYRYTIIDLEDEEKQRTQNQALSQTEWITCYTINPEKGSRLEYRLTIIDTPGFGDTRGLKRDNEIVDQIRELFSANSTKGVAVIDAVCFLIKAPDARLTATQKYIFHAIMSLFGQDIERNICSLITFADGQVPPVIASLQESNLPFGKYFTFNNSGLFSKNTDIDSASLSPMFWEMGVKSYRAFFDNLAKMETKSLQLTKQVLDERQKLELTIATLQPQVDAGLSKVAALKQEMKIIEQHQTDIKDNKNFEYEVEETRQTQKELPKGQHVTNCLHCHVTCHDNCVFADDEDKKRCSAMDKEGNCKICSDKCHWTQHKNTPYIFEYQTKKVKKTYKEKLERYENASGKLLNAEEVLEKMYEEFEELEEGIEELMEEVNESNNRLKEIALRPNPLSMVEHIDLMIEAEKMEKKEGFQNRITALMEYKKKAEITGNVERFKQAAQGTQRERPNKSNKKKKKFSLIAYLKKWSPF